MPEITDITAIRVVVARMMPSRVRKLRSLLPRSDWTAATTASQNDARALIYCPYVDRDRLFLTSPKLYFIILGGTGGQAPEGSRGSELFGPHNPAKRRSNVPTRQVAGFAGQSQHQAIL